MDSGESVVVADTATDHATSMQRWTALTYGVICHACFALGVAAMVTAMYFGMSRSLGRVPAPWDWFANALLLAQFPLAHSLLLTTRGRHVLARLAPSGAGRTLAPTTFVMIAALQTLALFTWWSPSGIIWWTADGATRVVITAVYVCSWLILGKAMADASIGLQTGSLGWVALWRNKTPIYPRMPVGGLFRFTRQPIYVAFTLTLWTVPTWTPDQVAVAVTFTAYCLVGPLFKEARFRRRYGMAFDRYVHHVPYWLPGLRKPRQLRGTLCSCHPPQRLSQTSRGGTD